MFSLDVFNLVDAAIKNYSKESAPPSISIQDCGFMLTEQILGVVQLHALYLLAKHFWTTKMQYGNQGLL